MQYRRYGALDYQVSLLGLGCMRLPLQTDPDGKVSVNEEKAIELIRYAVDHGINYLDTAFTYHNCNSEAILGRALEGGYRKKAWIATKQPLFVMQTNDDIRRNLESTLQKLRTDYLDVYLIHNIGAGNWDEIRRRGIYDEFVKFKEEGLIGAVGFSYHGELPTFRDALAEYPWDMCQVQQNLLDVDKEVTEEAIRLAGKKETALVIMEPLRGGGLCNSPHRVENVYAQYPQQRSATEWAFRHLIDYPEVSCILSGMSNLEQLQENIALFSKPDALPNCLSAEERQILRKAKDAYEELVTIPCTECGYCMPCPQNVNIPGVFSRYNAGMMFEDFDQPQRSYMLLKGAGQTAEHCIRCSACEPKCPQGIPIMEQLRVAHEALQGWQE